MPTLDLTLTLVADFHYTLSALFIAKRPDKSMGICASPCGERMLPGMI
jgi:hypothetical protein